VTDKQMGKYMRYLDRLRDSGQTNMYGARPWLVRRFGLSDDEAKKVLNHWMRTFDERHAGKEI